MGHKQNVTIMANEQTSLSEFIVQTLYIHAFFQQ